MTTALRGSGGRPGNPVELGLSGPVLAPSMDHHGWVKPAPAAGRRTTATIFWIIVLALLVVSGLAARRASRLVLQRQLRRVVRG